MEKYTKISSKNNFSIAKKSIDMYVKNLNNEQKFKFWIKTLLSCYGKIPNIIKTVDKIIDMQASSVSFIYDIYNKEKSTFNQLEKVIDLSERKNKLLNIYVMIKNLIKTLSFNDSDFIEKKFIYNWTADDLAKEFNISLRTVYRKVDRIITDIYNQALRKNWSLAFIESQIKDEPWLKEMFVKQVLEYFKLTRQCQSKSSSES